MKRMKIIAALVISLLCTAGPGFAETDENVFAGRADVDIVMGRVLAVDKITYQVLIKEIYSGSERVIIAAPEILEKLQINTKYAFALQKGTNMVVKIKRHHPRHHSHAAQ